MKLLVAYASKHGSSAEIALFIAQVFTIQGVEVTVKDVKEVESVEGYDAYILGSPIYGGLWLTEMSRFLDKVWVQLHGKPVYFWISCIRILESDGLQHALDNYIHRRVLDEIGVREVAVFAGKIRLDEIDWNERWTLSARYDGKALPGSRNDDFRDWDAIRAWAEKIRAEVVKA